MKTLELHKVTFQLHGIVRDDAGRVVDDFHAEGGVNPDGSRFPLVIFEHQVDEFASHVRGVLARTQAQLEEQAALEGAAEAKQAPEAKQAAPNRAQRRASARKPAARKPTAKARAK